MASTPAARAAPGPGWRAARAAALACLPLALLAGCAGPQTLKVAAGQTEAEMLAAMGPPSGRYPLADGAQRVEYAKGPMGRVTFMIDLDKSGRITQAEQVLTRQHFGRVQPNMTRQEVQLILGRPGERQPEYMGKETWSWRYPNYECLWAQVTFSPKGLTTSGVSISEDPRCDVTQ